MDRDSGSSIDSLIHIRNDTLFYADKSLAKGWQVSGSRGLPGEIRLFPVK